jgi:hypothetical protein
VWLAQIDCPTFFRELEELEAIKEAEEAALAEAEAAAAEAAEAMEGLFGGGCDMTDLGDPGVDLMKILSSKSRNKLGCLSPESLPNQWPVL